MTKLETFYALEGWFFKVLYFKVYYARITIFLIFVCIVLRSKNPLSFLNCMFSVRCGLLLQGRSKIGPWGDGMSLLTATQQQIHHRIPQFAVFHKVNRNIYRRIHWIIHWIMHTTTLLSKKYLREAQPTKNQKLGNVRPNAKTCFAQHTCNTDCNMR